MNRTSRLFGWFMVPTTTVKKQTIMIVCYKISDYHQTMTEQDKKNEALNKNRGGNDI